MKQKTPIIDKNGKPTHVHKNVETASSTRVNVTAPPVIAAGSWDDFIPASPKAVSMNKDAGSGYSFFFINDAAPDEFKLDGGYMDDYMEFSANDIRALPKEIDDAIYGVQLALEDVTHTDETKYMQRVFLSHLEVLKEQLATDGLDEIKRRGRAHGNAYIAIDKLQTNEKLEQYWEIGQAGIEKIYSYGNHLKAIGTTDDDFPRTLWETLKTNEPHIVDAEMPYTEDASKLYAVIKKAMEKSGF